MLARCTTTRDASRCIDTNVTSNPSLCNKSLRARNKVTHVELLRGLCRDMLCLWSIETNNAKNQKIFCPPKKRAKLNARKYNDDFRKVVISDYIPNALRDLHASKYKRPCNKPNDGCLRKPAKRNSVRASKQLRFFAFTEIFNGNQALTSEIINNDLQRPCL